MPRSLILLLLLPGCFGSNAQPPVLSPTADLAVPLADPALFRTCPGWTGPQPLTGREFVLAAEAEIACGNQMRGQLVALAETYGAQ